MKVQFEEETQNKSNGVHLVELCDGEANYYVMSCTEASKMIDLISLR